VGERTCSIPGCERPAGIPGTARDWCRYHYKRWYRYGSPIASVRRIQSYGDRTCAVEGCGERAELHGLCERHHARKKRLGTTELPVRVPRQCSLDGCDNPYYGDGLCRKHYDLRRGPRPGQRDPERARHTAKRRRARLAGARGRHSEVEWIAKLAEFGGRCAYCDAVAEAKDHVVPLRRGGTDDIDNIVPACHPCNSSKHTQTLAEWYGFVEPERAAPRMRGSWSNEDRCA
jgi:5-methylcytosine-specific restriction endonuclease McrA